MPRTRRPDPAPDPGGRVAGGAADVRAEVTDAAERVAGRQQTGVPE
ncbi:hypothetical protein Kpho01_24340 [Kitasatospora phosalacinea]|uniref:Uncharacterized protein n=1 Tax=Kitasatospora phosalacinea TaxID=2065 RepID=A0A9W6PGD7_9ACTN|nr:hypothetical protein Kpho01_24340 [Kitasatospora phosalacinea]